MLIIFMVYCMCSFARICFTNEGNVSIFITLYQQCLIQFLIQSKNSIDIFECINYFPFGYLIIKISANHIRHNDKAMIPYFITIYSILLFFIISFQKEYNLKSWKRESYELK